MPSHKFLVMSLKMLLQATPGEYFQFFNNRFEYRTTYSNLMLNIVHAHKPQATSKTNVIERQYNASILSKGQQSP